MLIQLSGVHFGLKLNAWFQNWIASDLIWNHKTQYDADQNCKTQSSNINTTSLLNIHLKKHNLIDTVLIWFVIPLLPNVNIHILHTDIHRFPKVVTRVIFSTIKSFFSWWSFSLFRGNILRENKMLCTLRGWKVLKKADTESKFIYFFIKQEKCWWQKKQNFATQWLQIF